MSLLSVIQSHCRKHALAVPSGIIGNTDTQVNQLYEVLVTLLDDIADESTFNVATQEAVFSCIPNEDQGALDTLAPNGYASAIFETFYDRTQRMPLVGPVNESEWQQLKALPSTGIRFKFRIRQDHLLLYPTPTAPFSDIAFEYRSTWLTTSAAGTLKAQATADTDLFLLPENIIKKGLSFSWKRIKGLPYQADEKDFWDSMNKYIATDKVKRRIDVSDGPVDAQPGVFISPYNTVPR